MLQVAISGSNKVLFYILFYPTCCTISVTEILYNPWCLINCEAAACPWIQRRRKPHGRHGGYVLVYWHVCNDETNPNVGCRRNVLEFILVGRPSSRFDILCAHRSQGLCIQYRSKSTLSCLQGYVLLGGKRARGGGGGNARSMFLNSVCWAGSLLCLALGGSVRRCTIKDENQ